MSGDSNQGADRREHPRVPAHFDVEYVVEAVEDAALATTLDVSLGGVAFPCAHALELGTVLNLKISGADLPCTFTAEGEVRRCWRAGDQICVAVKFTTLEAVGRAEILKISGRSFG